MVQGGPGAGEGTGRLRVRFLLRHAARAAAARPHVLATRGRSGVRAGGRAELWPVAAPLRRRPRRRRRRSPGMTSRSRSSASCQRSSPFRSVPKFGRRSDHIWRTTFGASQCAPPAQRGFGVLYILGRLKTGVTLEAAQRELTGISRRLSIADTFSTTGGWGARVIPVVDHHLGVSTRQALQALGAASAFVLLL